MRAKIYAALAASTMLAGASPALSQTLNTLFLTPDSTTSPLYTQYPNNGENPDLRVRSITGFDRSFGYGSSSTNTRRADGNINQPSSPGGVFTEVNSNGHIIYIELFSGAVGSYDGRGSNFTGALAGAPISTNLADGGSTSVTALTGTPAGCTLNTAPAGQPANGTCTQQPQVLEFSTVFGRYRPGDIVVQWSGINDLNTNNINAANQANVNTIVQTNITNQLSMVNQNVALGARNYVFIGLADLGTFANFTTLRPTNEAAVLTAAASAVNAGNLAGLTAIHNTTGANIHYVDLFLLVNSIRANPTAYGFTNAGLPAGVNGVAPNAYGIGTFGSAAAYDAQAFNVQNQFLTPDGLHWTYRWHDILAQVITNQLLAPYTIAPQADLANASARVFANSIFGRLDAYRMQNSSPMTSGGSYNYAAEPALAVPGMPAASGLPLGYAAIDEFSSADLIRKAPVYKAPPLPPPPQWQIFAMGTYASGSRDDRAGAAGFDYDIGAGTIGIEYRWSPNLLVGLAFSYSNPNVSNFSLIGNSNIDLKSYTIGGYASWNQANFFSDVLLSYAFNNYDLDRPGIINRITGSPDGNSFVAAWKGGYLFDAQAIRVGPIAGLMYSHVDIDAYTEVGDPNLNQFVASQSRDGLVGSVGAQFRLPYGVRSVNPFLNLTWEHEFERGTRTITTAQTFALGLPIATLASGEAGRDYGKVAGGASFDLGGRFSANINAETTFGRSGGNDWALTVGLTGKI